MAARDGRFAFNLVTKFNRNAGLDNCHNMVPDMVVLLV